MDNQHLMYIVLQLGSALLFSQPYEVHTNDGNIFIKPTATVFINKTNKYTTIYNLCSTKPYSVTIETNNHVKFTLAPSRLAIISKSLDQSCMPKLKLYNLVRINNDLVVGNYIISEALRSDHNLRTELFKYENKGVLNQVLKSSAILEDQEYSSGLLNSHIPMVKHPSGKL